MKVLVRKIHDHAKLPTQSHDDVGFDLYAAEETHIGPGFTAVVKTGIELAADPGDFAIGNVIARSLLKIEGRSGMALRGIWPVGGIIDPGYRGEIGVVLYNSTLATYTAKPGDRIAQLVWYPVIAKSLADPNIGFEWSEESDESSRGDKGFGSSGT